MLENILQTLTQADFIPCGGNMFRVCKENIAIICELDEQCLSVIQGEAEACLCRFFIKQGAKQADSVAEKVFSIAHPLLTAGIAILE